jgi:hypothetical protein
MEMDRSMVTAADYHDAIAVTRKAKSTVALLALLMLLGQLALFLTARYTSLIVPDASTAATQPVEPTRLSQLLHYALGLTVFVGMACAMLLSLLLLVLTLIMLSGRLLGVGRVASALVLSLVLLVLLFPWQAFLGGELLTRDFVIPGVLFTWDELRAGAKFVNDFSGVDAASATVLKWARFAAFPLVAVVLLLLVQKRSTRGVREAVSEPI